MMKQAILRYHFPNKTTEGSTKKMDLNLGHNIFPPANSTFNSVLIFIWYIWALESTWPSPFRGDRPLGISQSFCVVVRGSAIRRSRTTPALNWSSMESPSPQKTSILELTSDSVQQRLAAQSQKGSEWRPIESHNRAAPVLTVRVKAWGLCLLGGFFMKDKGNPEGRIGTGLKDGDVHSFAWGQTGGKWESTGGPRLWDGLQRWDAEKSCGMRWQQENPHRGALSLPQLSVTILFQSLDLN